MFNKIISRMGEPTARKEDPNDQHLTETLDIVSKFLRTVYGLCKRINADDLDDSKTLINCIWSRPAPFKYKHTTSSCRCLPLSGHVVQQVSAHSHHSGVAFHSLSRAHGFGRVHAAGVRCGTGDQLILWTSLASPQTLFVPEPSRFR